VSRHPRLVCCIPVKVAYNEALAEWTCNRTPTAPRPFQPPVGEKSDERSPRRAESPDHDVTSALKEVNDTEASARPYDTYSSRDALGRGILRRGGRPKRRAAAGAQDDQDHWRGPAELDKNASAQRPSGAIRLIHWPLALHSMLAEAKKGLV